MMNNLATKMTTTKAPPMTETKITARNVQVFYGDKHALKDVNIDIRPRSVTAFIGPSGCGKSTFLRCINRMNDTIASCRVEGNIMIDAENIYDAKVDPVQLRAKVGMVFQKPNPFPKSIYDNVAYGPKIHGLTRNKAELDAILAFYRTPAGQALMRKEPAVAAAIGQATGQLIGAKIDAAMQANAKRLGAALAPLSSNAQQAKKP